MQAQGVREQVLARCQAVVLRARELYNLDLSVVQISFNLRGRAAGRAEARGFLGSRSYTVKFNADMLTREAADHILQDTIPHEYAHIICFMKPELGRNHDSGWRRVCESLGGSGARCHQEAVVYGRGRTYEYITDRGHPVRLSERRHRYIQTGGVLRYRQGMGMVSRAQSYSIVGEGGRSIQPVEPAAPAAPAAPTAPVATPPAARMPVLPQQPGTSKASRARLIMQQGYGRSASYEEIIRVMMTMIGYDRQLARATFKANAPKVGIPLSFYS